MPLCIPACAGGGGSQRAGGMLNTSTEPRGAAAQRGCQILTGGATAGRFQGQAGWLRGSSSAALGSCCIHRCRGLHLPKGCCCFVLVSLDRGAWGRVRSTNPLMAEGVCALTSPELFQRLPCRSGL